MPVDIRNVFTFLLCTCVSQYLASLFKGKWNYLMFTANSEHDKIIPTRHNTVFKESHNSHRPPAHNWLEKYVLHPKNLLELEYSQYGLLQMEVNITYRETLFYFFLYFTATVYIFKIK